MADNFTGFGDLPNTMDDLSVMSFIARSITNGMATATLVKVKAISGDTVDVQPMVNQIDGSNKAIPHGIIHALPWFRLRAGVCEIRLAPKAGDIGLAVFCHSDISSVKNTKDIANPASLRRFDWSDGVYLGGLLGATPTTLIEVDSSNNIVIMAPTVKITGNVEVTGDMTVSGTVTGTTDVVGGGKHLKTHTHGGVTTGSGTSGPPS